MTQTLAERIHERGYTFVKNSETIEDDLYAPNSHTYVRTGVDAHVQHKNAPAQHLGFGSEASPSLSALDERGGQIQEENNKSSGQIQEENNKNSGQIQEENTEEATNSLEHYMPTRLAQRRAQLGPGHDAGVWRGFTEEHTVVPHMVSALSGVAGSLLQV